MIEQPGLKPVSHGGDHPSQTTGLLATHGKKRANWLFDLSCFRFVSNRLRRTFNADAIQMKNWHTHNNELKRRIERLKRKWRIRRTYESPKMRIESTMASPSFAAKVKEIVDTIDLFDSTLFHPQQQQFFCDLKLHGHDYALVEFLKRGRRHVNNEVDLGKAGVLLTRALGDAIIDQIDDVCFPMNDIEVHYMGNEIVLALSSMHQRMLDEREIFYSRRRLQIEIESKKYFLAFNRHSIERICRRYRPDYLTYIGLGESHALFSYLNYAEVVTLPRGNLAVSIFDICLGPGMWQYDNYVCRCLPESPPRGPEVWHETGIPYAYRIGYCPIDLTGEYAITKTFLPPGYAKTPERQLLNQKCFDSHERYRLSRIASNMHYHSLRLGKGFDAIEWFHKNGVPQVIEPPIPPFNREYFERKIGRGD